MNNIKRFSSRKEVTEFLKEKEIDTSNWSEEKWLSLNKGHAEIHIMDLAEKIYDAVNESTPKQLKAGEWHIPFGDDIFTDSKGWVGLGYTESNYISGKIKIATARCARVSYTIVGSETKEKSYEDDIALHDRLLIMQHLSPFEHCASAMSKEEIDIDKGRSGNFYGFNQYRQMLIK